MRFLDLTFPQPAANLALDEALLDECEETGTPPCLRLWESTTYFVVVGYGEVVAREVDQPACQAEGVPILRRCSGGGTVLQGPGCLNYALILPLHSQPEFATVSGANRFIMGCHRRALGTLTGQEVTLQACTDLALGGRKFSGNSQRRKRQHLLFHGTFLLQFDLARMQRLLRFPSRSPDYRAERRHVDFLTCLDLPAAAVKDALRAAWQATESTATLPVDRLDHLLATKYSQPHWNLRDVPP